MDALENDDARRHCITHLYTLRYLAVEIIIPISTSLKLAMEGSERSIRQLNSPALGWIWESP